MKKQHYVLLLVIVTVIVGFAWLFYRYQLARAQHQRETYVDTLFREESSDFPLNLKWQVELGSYTYDFPVYQDGLVMVPARVETHSTWYGIEATTGQIVWKSGVGELNYFRCLTDKYLVVSGQHTFVNLEFQTGKVVWRKEKADNASCSNRAVFFSDVPRNSIQAADLATGQEFWRGTTPRKSFSGLIYNPQTNKIIAKQATTPWYTYFIEADTGLLETSIPQLPPAPQDGPPLLRGPMYLIDRGELFLGGNVLDANTGQFIHKEEHYRTGRTPTTTKDAMYLAAFSDGVVAFDRATYNTKWIYPPPQPKPGLTGPLKTISSVAILDEIGYVIFSDATLRAFDLETGDELGYWQPSKEDLWNWRVCTFPPPPVNCIEAARTGLIASDDALLVSFGDGKLYAFSE